MAPQTQRRFALKNAAPGLTLLEAARQDVKELREVDHSKLDWEGFGFGAESSPTRKAPTSPASPIKSAVATNSMSQPKVAMVHRVRLRNFDEKCEPSSRIITRRYSTDCSPSDAPSDAPVVRRRSNSLSFTGESLVDGSSEAFLRPQSAGAADRSSSTGRVGTPDEPQMRNLSNQELAKKNRDAAEWFRASRSINQKIRSIEDTETLLTMARERRASGSVNVRRKSKEIPLDAAPAAEKPPPAPEVRKRRTVDAAALWGPKPIKAKPKEEEPKQEILESLGIEKKINSCMRGNVTVGATGENGLLARLRRRKTVQ